LRGFFILDGVKLGVNKLLGSNRKVGGVKKGSNRKVGGVKK
jgi:hypothetical protein